MAFNVKSGKMKRMKRKPCPARINRLFRTLIPGKKIFVFDDTIYNIIAKGTKVPRLIVRKCVRDYQPFVRISGSSNGTKVDKDLHGNCKMIILECMKFD